MHRKGARFGRGNHPCLTSQSSGSFANVGGTAFYNAISWVAAVVRGGRDCFLLPSGEGVFCTLAVEQTYCISLNHPNLCLDGFILCVNDFEGAQSPPG